MYIMDRVNDCRRDVHNLNIRELSQEELQEESFVDLAFALLEETHETKLFLEIVEEVEKLLGLTREDSKPKLGQFYTDMNIDGRFLILGENRWGLREWYPVEQIEEESAPTVKARKKKKVVEDDFDDVEELELEDELLEDDFVEDDDEDEDDEDDLATAVKAEPLNFDEDDDEDEVDVDVLVEDMDGNIIDEEDEDEEDDLK